VRRVVDRYSRHVEAVGRDALLQEHGGLVHRTARRVSIKVGKDDIVDDLVSVGLVALFEAHQKYDPTQGVPFPSYAYRRIQGAMIDEARRLDVLPRRLRARTVLLEKRRQELTMKFGREPSREELARELDWETGVVEETEMVAREQLPIEDFENTVASEFDPLEDIISSRQTTVVQALARIPERLQLVLQLRFVEEFSVKEVGDLLGLSKTRAHGLIQEALLQVRNNLGVNDVDASGGDHERVAETAPRKAAAVDG
jgi:RNA polymerase sigma factor for flagellar operon FliA